ncbi:Gfo/Idh/MocA family oxidoreductase [Alkalihalobacillus sp. LMS6]|uniref:Gfo/Idh/MocA family protein n=1 Tax=Alkalihalobacillus sp. LMS6 TaxID=2924034 RepID=UPI0020D18DED|nr:Gfo/Idh/MocA family oxidoreductase [Alkalihalobacillus sp. LMS6]UTR07262.1 Gfo/Idh/MocA family oxidoreductase [Alkalihalobacillus sp. LMS6]
MKVGIVSFAHGHANAYASSLVSMDDVELVGIYDDVPERGKEAAIRFQTNYLRSYQELLSKKLDAVIVTSENAKHLEHVEEAAKAGVAILCEKPLADTITDAEKMIHVCKEANVFLQTAFPVRFNEVVRRAKERIDSGEFGKIVAIKGTNRGKNPGGWFTEKEKSGGGAVIDHTVHVVDVMRWILQDEVADVYAEIDQFFSGKSLDDAGILNFSFTNGVIATLDCSWSRNEHFPIWGDVTMEFIGTEGTMKIDAQGQKLSVYDASGIHYQVFADDMDHGLVKDFISRVRSKKAPSITGEDGLCALEVAIGAYASSENGERVQLKSFLQT